MRPLGRTFAAQSLYAVRLCAREGARVHFGVTSERLLWLRLDCCTAAAAGFSDGGGTPGWIPRERSKPELVNQMHSVSTSLILDTLV